MKTKNLAYIATTITLIALALLVTNQHPFGKRNSSFAVGLNSTVTSVEFTQGREQLILERNDDSQWFVNGNKYEARVNGINFIEKILTSIEIKSPVTEETFYNEITSKDIEPVRVRIFDKQKVLKSFFVYKTNANIYGNIMKTSLKSKPFITWVPGYDNNIGAAFTLNENYWRPYTLFSLMPTDIQTITLENNADSTASFSIMNNIATGQLAVYPTTSNIDDSLKITRYLTYYSMVPFESWALDIPDTRTAEITGISPLFKITVGKTSGEKITVSFWPLDNNGTIDTDRLWARIDDNTNLIVVKYFDVDPIIKKRSYFFVN